MIYIGTHNAAKAKSMASAIHLADGSIKLSGIVAYGFPVPEENGKTEQERAEAKAQYYFQHLNQPTISEDDGLYFEPSLPIESLSVADVDMHGLSPFEFWRSMFETNGTAGGTLRKAYSICTASACTALAIDIPFTLRLIATGEKPTGRNVLNYFMVPEGAQQPLAAMTDDERNAFRRRHIVAPLRRLLAEAQLIQK